MAPLRMERCPPADDDPIQPEQLELNHHADETSSDEEPMDDEADSEIEVVYDGPSTNYRHPIPEHEDQTEELIYWDSDEETSHYTATRSNESRYSPMDDCDYPTTDSSDNDDDQDESSSDPYHFGSPSANARIVPYNREAANMAQRNRTASQSEANDTQPPIEHWPLVDILGKTENDQQLTHLQEMQQWIAEQLRHASASRLKDNYAGIIRCQNLVRIRDEFNYLINLHKNASVLNDINSPLPNNPV